MAFAVDPIAGFHAGELAVQSRAGVTGAAARLSGMLAAPDLVGGIGRFLADRTFAAITARDADGALWLSPLTGPPGFLDVQGSTSLVIHGRPTPQDPLRALAAGQPVGLLVMEYANRRRARINGTLVSVGPGMLRIDVNQAYGNCPQYIHQRRLEVAERLPSELAARVGTALTAEDVALIGRADTMLLGTSHPQRGNDASHRGGPAGFVRVEDGRLWWPDYPGNNMFNSMGNLAIDPSAALLFNDFDSGESLQLSGRAQVRWTEPGDDDVTGRRVLFTPDLVVTRDARIFANHVAAAS